MTFQKVERKVLCFGFTVYDAVDWEINQKIFWFYYKYFAC